jgi:hypothetical protein
MPLPAPVRFAVVLAQDVPAPVAVEVAPDRADVIPSRVVELDEVRCIPWMRFAMPSIQMSVGQV